MEDGECVLHTTGRTAADEEFDMLREDVRKTRDEIRRAVAIERLADTLEKNGVHVRRHPARVGSDEMAELSLLMRLRSARAAYRLETSGEVERVSPGAYMLQRNWR
jgi:predicted transcriptional regulator of viral defense system